MTEAVFPIWDLLRFRKFYNKTESLLSDLKVFSDKFKIVRIKDKMSTPLHQIFINFVLDEPTIKLIQKNLIFVCVVRHVAPSC